MISLFFFLWPLLLDLPLSEPVQDVTEPISIIHYFNEKTLCYDIYCENTGPDFYSIELGFEYLRDLRPSTPYPLRKTVPPGRHLIMKLTQNDINSRGSFKIKLSYRRGKLSYDIDEQFPYLFPLKVGSFARTLCRDSLLLFYPHQKDTCFHLTGFFAQSGDTIFASRRGVVSKIQNFISEDSFNSKNFSNYLDVQHPDGSYGRYEGIQNNCALATIGQMVEAGDPIAVVRFIPNTINTFFTFRVFYYSEKVVTRKISHSNTKMTTMPVSFHGLTEVVSLCCTQTYPVCHPEDIVMREMSKREVKRWLKRQRTGQR